MGPRTLLRLAGTAAAALLAVGVPASGAVHGPLGGPVAVPGAAGCSASDLHVSYDLDPGPPASVAALRLGDVPAACEGRWATVELARERTTAVLTSPTTAVPLAARPAVEDVVGVSVTIGDPPAG